jgi:hypothetical protein
MRSSADVCNVCAPKLLQILQKQAPQTQKFGDFCTALKLFY